MVVPESIKYQLDEDDLPYSDGEPMESQNHYFQLEILIEPLRERYKNEDIFIAGNMFVYYRPDQWEKDRFKGPDFFAVKGVENRPRKSWVSWKEGKGPDVVIELLSESTSQKDKVANLPIYQNNLKVAEYFWYDPIHFDFEGYRLEEGRYHPIEKIDNDTIYCSELELYLMRWEGTYRGIHSTWLRWCDTDGNLITTGYEQSFIEHLQAEQEKRLRIIEKERADQEKERADQEKERADQEKIKSDKYLAMLRELGIDPESL